MTYSWQQWLFQVTLPLMVTIIVDTWYFCGKVDRLNAGLDVKNKERASPFRR